MKNLNDIINWLVSSGFVGIVLAGVLPVISAGKRQKIEDTEAYLSNVASANAKRMFRQPDATGERVANAITDILVEAQKPWYYHTFSDSTLGHIAQTAVHDALNDPDVVNAIQGEIKKEHEANTTYNYNVSMPSNSTAPVASSSTAPVSSMTIDQSIAVKDVK